MKLTLERLEQDSSTSSNNILIARVKFLPDIIAGSIAIYAFELWAVTAQTFLEMETCFYHQKL